jgi:hypothetical protein
VDHLIDIRNSDRQANQDMGAIACFAETIFRAAADNLFAEFNKGADKIE